MMNANPHILLLSCFTGEGHNSAARALQEEFQRSNIASRMADPVSFQSKRAQNFVSSCYNSMIRKTPAAFGALYKAGELYGKSGITSPVYYANAHYASKLLRFIEAEGFDAVVSTHLYGMEVMTAINKRLGKHIPSYGVLTDYTCIPFLDEVKLNAWFVPHEEIGQELQKKGVPGKQIIPSGIPVSARFMQHGSKEDARKALQMPLYAGICLLMTGGVGCEKMCGLCDAFLEHDRNDLFFYVLVGRNERLQQQICDRYGANGRIRAVPFTKEVHRYLEAADVLISKPGGLSSTEAAVANIPLVHYGIIPGCETQNAAFFARHGMSLQANREKEAIALALNLLQDRQAIERMRARQRQVISPHAAETIVRYVVASCS